DALARGDLVGGRIDVFTTAARPSGADLFEQLFAFDQRGYIEGKGFTVTANLFCRRETFSAVGPFANGVSEDLEWCRRARRAGFSLVYEDEAVVRHPTRPDWISLQAKWRRLTREAFLLHRMEGGSRVGWALRQVAVAGSAAPHTLRVLRADLPVGDKVRAAGGLWRIRTWRALEGLKLSLAGQR
ncbi:glycosyltransferase family 2 protein, partial [Qipengyuania sp.]|uniref:glycosyltransferase family 2 protein n=1 Tax=Qipengyuania sp. TaxID=2004515 RepID=UPI0035C820A7